MKTDTLRWLGVSAAAAVGAWCWYLLRMDADSVPRVAKSLPTAPRMFGNPPAPKPSEQPPEVGTPEFKRIALERGQKWLASRGRDAASLIAMWDLTSDEGLLMEAAGKFPRDPRVCMVMIQRAGGAHEALPWIERLIDAEPKNPQGRYLRAWALMTGNDRAGTIAALRKAGAMNGERDPHARDRMKTVREAAVAGGASPGDAARLAIAPSLQNRTRSPALNSAIYQLLSGAWRVCGRRVAGHTGRAGEGGEVDGGRKVARLRKRMADRISLSFPPSSALLRSECPLAPNPTAPPHSMGQHR